MGLGRRRKRAAAAGGRHWGPRPHLECGRSLQLSRPRGVGGQAPHALPGHLTSPWAWPDHRMLTAVADCGEAGRGTRPVGTSGPRSSNSLRCQMRPRLHPFTCSRYLARAGAGGDKAPFLLPGTAKARTGALGAGRREQPLPETAPPAETPPTSATNPEPLGVPAPIPEGEGATPILSWTSSRPHDSCTHARVYSRPPPLCAPRSPPWGSAAAPMPHLPSQTQ